MKVSCTNQSGSDVCTECHNKPTYSYIEHADGVGHPGSIVACSKCHRMFTSGKFKPSDVGSLFEGAQNAEAAKDEVRYGSE